MTIKDLSFGKTPSPGVMWERLTEILKANKVLWHEKYHPHELEIISNEQAKSKKWFEHLEF